MKENVFYEKIGQKISSLRNKKAIKQDDLAQLLSLSRASVVNIEKGRQKISVFDLIKISKFLNVELKEIIPETTHFDFEVKNIIGFGIDKSILNNPKSSVYKFLDFINTDTNKK